jgi:hypothetical protein
MAVKVSRTRLFFRFGGYTSFRVLASSYAAWLIPAILAPLPRLLGMARLLSDNAGYRPARCRHSAGALPGYAWIPEKVIHGDEPGKPGIAARALDSDPRGYRYTLQETSYYRISIRPDRFNTISITSCESRLHRS